MATLTVTIDLDGPAIAEDPVAEITRMLTRVAEDLQEIPADLVSLATDPESSATDRGRIRDTIGTTRGRWVLRPTPRCGECGAHQPERSQS